MKREGFLFEEIVSVENCKQAILDASKHKTFRRGVCKILDNLDFYANNLSRRLIDLDFTTPYKTRIIDDGLSGKTRVLQIPSFYPDQCAHHAIMRVLMPIIMKSSYHWSCANILFRGNRHACIGVERATRRDTRNAKYCVKLDISKFYPSVQHDVIEAALRRKIKDEKAMQIILKVVHSCEGLPIGNYTSPFLAELVLQPVDMFIKQELRVKHYVRYADDMVLLGANKKKLRKAMYAVIEKLRSLKLKVKANYQLFRVYRNGVGRKIDFVGKCFGIGVTTVRKRRALAFMRQSRRIQKLQRNGVKIPFKYASGFMARASCLQYTDTKSLKEKYYNTINIKELREVIRNESKRQFRARKDLRGKVPSHVR